MPGLLRIFTFLGNDPTVTILKIKNKKIEKNPIAIEIKYIISTNQLVTLIFYLHSMSYSIDNVIYVNCSMFIDMS